MFDFKIHVKKAKMQNKKKEKCKKRHKMHVQFQNSCKKKRQNKNFLFEKYTYAKEAENNLSKKHAKKKDTKKVGGVYNLYS